MRAHGRISTYTHGRCRCASCKAAARVYRRRFRRVDEKPVAPEHREWVIEQDRRENREARVARFHEPHAERRVLPDGRIEERYRDRSGRVVEVRRSSPRSTTTPTIPEWRTRAAAASADDWMPLGDFVFHGAA